MEDPQDDMIAGLVYGLTEEDREPLTAVSKGKSTPRKDLPLLKPLFKWFLIGVVVLMLILLLISRSA